MQEIITLGFLFDPKDLFVNDRGSGGSDGLNLRLVVSPDLKDAIVWSGILNLCARLCFETLSFDTSLIVQKNDAIEKGTSLLVDLHGLDKKDPGVVTIEKIDDKQVRILSTSAQALEMVLNCLAISSLGIPLALDFVPDQTEINTLTSGDRLTGIFKPQGILSNCSINGRTLGDICLTTMGVKMERKEKKYPFLFHPLDFIGLYRKELATPTSQTLDAVWYIQSPAISFNTGIALFNAISAMVMEATVISLPMVAGCQGSTDSGEPGIFGSGSFCFVVNEIDLGDVGDNKSTRQLTVQFSDLTGPINISGSAQGFSDHLSSWVDLALNQGGPGFSRSQTLRNQIDGFVGDAHDREEIMPIHEKVLPIVHEFVLGSETDEILELLSSVETGQGAIFCEIWTSKPADIRSQLNNKIKNILISKGYNPEILTLNAFKPGICRILDIDLPVLLKKKPARIHITYRPFDTENNAMELEHRWLHELFPVAEILAQKLSIPEEAVMLFMVNDQKEIYGLTAFDQQNSILFQDHFSPFFHTFEYMEFCPGQGIVSPTCAGITIIREDQVLISQSISTDRDRFWKQFQTAFIPDLIKSMERRIQFGSLEGQQPFFESIQVDVHIDESNFRLGFMDEQISPMEKLHEDIYFFLLKVFERFVIQYGLPESLKLGQILPRVDSTAGSKGARASIRAIPVKENKFASDYSGGSVMPFDTLAMDQDGWILSGTLMGEKCSFTLDFSPTESDLAYFGDISGPVPDDLVLTSETVGRHLSRLNKMAHIQVWEITRSLQGRPIYAVEAFAVKGCRVSVPRLRLARPTVLFNARHHANEVSSTNAVLRFVEFLGSDQGQACLETTNAVFIPLENVDGVATFESLYVKNSCDILHAARYNALGAEFYNEYFKHPPAFPEAFAKQRLWHRWLPELMADLHGVPGHEWCQPYAGYLPKGFREFWIPRAFVYVHLPFLEDPGHPMYEQTMGLIGIMRRAIAEEAKIVAANKKITALYQKYARIPEPDVFPKTDSTELTALPLLGRARNFNFAVQYPDITRAEVVVEVPDEVAHGENLALCVAAHYQIQKVLIQNLNQRDVRIIELQVSGSGCIEFEFCISQA
ncbi:MAG: hypothetical protein DRH26_01510 [Deltaproteobacteria bacterium]|nr:MAG: hypothetical protein DRH26_01510 [Deltaproteobacteria bacterium]